MFFKRADARGRKVLRKPAKGFERGEFSQGNFGPENAVMSGSALSDLTQAAIEATITATKPIKRGLWSPGSNDYKTRGLVKSDG